jgi:ectoine hydroxylase-related dioxygenase (phytanoyl-CoA dioxygenase family)
MKTLFSKVEQKSFEENGYVGPIRFCSEDQAKEWKNEFFIAIGQNEDEAKEANMDLSAFHHKYPWAYRLCSDENILDNISDLLDCDDVFLWAMHFWYKAPFCKKFIPWHQDKNYWPMKPAINVTAWIALGESNKENGCLRLIPKSHKKDYDHVDQGENSSFAQGVDVDDEKNAIDVEMKPGEVVFFNESTLHGSNANTSSMPRVACSVRYTVPSVKFKIDDWTGNKDRIKTFLVKGEDHYHYNDAITGCVPN